MAAAWFQTPELALDSEEATRLASAVAEVNRHYKIPALQPQHAALGQLVAAMFIVYRGKMSRISARKQRGDAPETAPQVPMTGAGANIPPAWFPDLTSQQVN